MRKRTGRPRVEGDVEDEIRRLALMNWTAAQISRELEKRPDFVGRVPQDRTMRRAVRWYRPDDTSGWWSVAEADPEDAALVLPVLAEGIERSGGWWQRFSKDLAGWIVKVRLAAPDMPPVWALQVAFSYWSHGRHDEPSDNLDTMLAFAPWRDQSHLRRYLLAVKMFHPDWFELFDVDGAVPRIRLARGVPWKPDAAALIVALDCVDIQQEEGTNDKAGK